MSCVLIQNYLFALADGIASTGEHPFHMSDPHRDLMVKMSDFTHPHSENLVHCPELSSPDPLLTFVLIDPFIWYVPSSCHEGKILPFAVGHVSLM